MASNEPVDGGQQEIATKERDENTDDVARLEGHVTVIGINYVTSTDEITLKHIDGSGQFSTTTENTGSHADAQSSLGGDTCEPCRHLGVFEKATSFCRHCDERYCQSCSFNHTAQKQTKSHKVVDIKEALCIAKFCEPCYFKQNDKKIDASAFCDDCKEYLCDYCMGLHSMQHPNTDHKLSVIAHQMCCEICKSRGGTTAASCYCIDCKDPELFCKMCSDRHIAMKQCQTHKMSYDLTTFLLQKTENSALNKTSAGGRLNIDTSSTESNSSEAVIDDKDKTTHAVHKCEPCAFQNLSEIASHYCLDCDERYCQNCTQRHKVHKRTRDHELIDLRMLDMPKQMCEPCVYNDTERQAMFICKDCTEYLCDECMKYHRSQKQNRDHSVEPFSSQILCESCLGIDEHVPAVTFCLDCEDSEMLCQTCSKRHLSTKITKHHQLSNDLTELNLRILRKKLAECKKLNINEPSVANEKKEEANRPGKPYVTETIMSNKLNIKWKDVALNQNEAYQVVFKEGINGKWKTHRYTTTISTLKMDGLQPQTSYVFKVRVINDVSGDEGPFSEESGLLTTGESPALGMMKKSAMICQLPIAAYALPVKEVKRARNERGKTRKLYLGRKADFSTEKTVMIVGATGSGKSTLINAIANYVMGVTWEDSFRFTLVNVETSEKDNEGNQARSQTDWVTCYIINNTISSRLKYTLNLIDTPGFGDTRGLEHDQKIVEQIRELFTAKNSQGVATIDAVCFILKAPDARLTPTQIYIFEAILSLFGNDIRDNICTLITFADGQRPPVLAALEALEHKSLPYEKYFTFNNSALFVDNSSTDPGNLSPTFWEMGMRSCEAFFDHLNTLQTKSLLLTSEVLTQRSRVENTVQHLYEEIDVGLGKIGVLEQEIALFTKYKQQIRENKDFTYTVTEHIQEKIDLQGKRQYTTNCLQCNFTCHENCAYANDNDKEKCCAMRNGVCTECPSKCHWTQHHNNPFIIKWIPKQVTKKYSEKQKIYQEATQKSLTQEQLLEEMSKDIENLECAITDTMDKIAYYNNRLKEIALRPDPLSTVQYLDLMIASERREKKSGFESRIDALEKCKKRAQYGNSVKVFQDRVRATKESLANASAEDEGTDGFLGAMKTLGKKFIHAIKI